MLSFQQQEPHPLLRRYIRSYWLIEGDHTHETLALVPDGYPEMFFVLAQSLKMGHFSGEKCWTPHTPGGVIGQATGRFAFESAARCKMLFVKFYPWTPHLLFGVPAWQLNDLALDLNTLTHGAAFQHLGEQVAAAPHLSHTVALLDAFFLKKLGTISQENSFLQLAIKQIYDSHGTVSVDGLMRRVQVSRRYVEKIFKDKIGMSPKQYAQVIRVKKASMYLLDPRFRGNIQAVANNLDYYDQSHLLKDFKAVVGQSPSLFLQQQLNFSESDTLAYLSQWDYS